MSTVAVYSYARTHTSVFVSDKLRNFLKLLVRHYGLNPQGVLDAWSSWVDRAARTWLESGHLRSIVIEFYRPGSNVAAARWIFRSVMTDTASMKCGSIASSTRSRSPKRSNLPPAAPTASFSRSGRVSRPSTV